MPVGDFGKLSNFPRHRIGKGVVLAGEISQTTLPQNPEFGNIHFESDFRPTHLVVSIFVQEHFRYVIPPRTKLYRGGERHLSVIVNPGSAEWSPVHDIMDI